jgi:hypothetical protein
MNPSSFELTLEQQFEYQRMVAATADMSKEQALELLIQAQRLLMIKSNVVRDLMERCPLEPLA